MIALHAGDAAVTVDPLGGRLASLRVDGLDLLTGGGSFPMAPWAGRVRRGRFTFGGVDHDLAVNAPPHAIHGTVRDRPWVVEEADPMRARLSTDLGPAWPFAGWAVQVLTLHADRLELRLEVHSADGPMPAACGWHPWWRRHLDRGGPVEVDLAAEHLFVRDGEGIPTGELVPPTPPPWDDCFTGLAAPPALRWPGALSLAVESTCAFVVVFDHPADSVCVEPQTGPPDALNLGPAVVRPGAPLTAAATFRWRPD